MIEISDFLMDAMEEWREIHELATRDINAALTAAYNRGYDTALSQTAANAAVGMPPPHPQSKIIH